MTDTPSPLNIVDPDALTRLFEADPTSVSDAELVVLVTELRRRRNAFLAEEAAKSLAPKAKRTPPGVVPSSVAAVLDKPVSEIDLNDI